VAGWPLQITEPAGRRHTPVVLVVDDDEDLRVVLRHGLAGAGFEVHEARDAVAAYAAAAVLDPDIVLLDWVMPGEDAGAVACGKLVQLLRHGEVVMFTGLSDVRDQRAAFDAGARAFLVKGMRLEELAAELRRLLGAGRFTRA
jgi:DNA-binding response OmpR family regulator